MSSLNNLKNTIRQFCLINIQTCSTRTWIELKNLSCYINWFYCTVYSSIYRDIARFHGKFQVKKVRNITIYLISGLAARFIIVIKIVRGCRLITSL